MVNFAGVWDYIEKTREKVHDLEVRVQKAKDNVEEIQKIMTTWTKQPLFERKEDKYDTLLNLDDREDRINKRYAEIRTYGDKIHELLKVLVFSSFLFSSLFFFVVSNLFYSSVAKPGEPCLLTYAVVVLFCFFRQEFDLHTILTSSLSPHMCVKYLK